MKLRVVTRRPRRASLVLAAALLLVTVACNGATLGAANVTATSATARFHGQCDANEACNVYVKYWKHGQYASTVNLTSVLGPFTNISCSAGTPCGIPLSNLSPGTTYDYVACGNSNGSAYGCVGPAGTSQLSPHNVEPTNYSSFTTAPLANSALTCGLNFLAEPSTPNDRQASILGSTTASVVRVAGDYGAIGTRLELHNNALPISEGWVDVLEGRSAAGGGWQSALGIGDRPHPQGVGFFHQNQSAGNANGTQWGYATTLTTPNTGTISQADHSAMWGDRYDWTPCAPNGPIGPGGLDAAKVNIVGETVAVPGQGNAVRWKHTWTLVPLTDQFWSTYVVNNALYLDKQVARWANLRLYLTDTNNVTTGPFAPYDPQSLMSIGSAVDGAGCAANVAPSVGATCNLPPLKSATLVYNIMGVDVGIGITAEDGDLSDSSLIGVGENVFLDDELCGAQGPWHDTCGALYFYANTYANNDNPAYGLMWPQHVPHSHTAVYHIGTKAQLTGLGFGWP